MLSYFCVEATKRNSWTVGNHNVRVPVNTAIFLHKWTSWINQRRLPVSYLLTDFNETLYVFFERHEPLIPKKPLFIQVWTTQAKLENVKIANTELHLTQNTKVSDRPEFSAFGSGVSFHLALVLFGCNPECNHNFEFWIKTSPFSLSVVTL